MTKFQTIFLFVLFISTLLLTFSTAKDALTTGHPLVDGETLVSAAGNFALGFFSPPGSKNRYVGIWYNKVSVQTVAWVANRETPVPNTNGTLSITRNGSLLITVNNSTIVLWSSAMADMIKPVAQLLDNGNFVVREAGSSDDTQGFAWQSFDHPADTLLPGMKLGWNLKKGLNSKLTAWTSASDPSPGAYSSSIDISGDPQLVLSQGSNWVWRAGPWDGVQFSGIPQMKTFLVFNYTFVDNQEEIYYQYNLTSDSTITRLAVDSAGTLERTVWLEQTGEWNVYWFWPNDECDSVSACGAFGVCNAENSPLCSCLPGFRPTSPEEWALRKTSRGCMRSTALDCRNGTDGFAKLTGMKLPDTSSATVDRSVGLDECMTRCLKNCSCTAYANADIRNGGSGCIIWTRELTDLRLYTYRGQDLYVRLASKDLDIIDSKSNQSYNRRRKQYLLIMGIVLAILLALCLGFFVWRMKKKKIVSSTRDSGVTIGNKDVETLGGSDVELPIFDFSRIVAATNNFSIRNKLGEGGFGPVYKGTLGEEEDIAVKRLSQNSVQGLDEFKNEVILISKLQHRNLVRLRGCCIECGERILIYEYMDNKSLDAFLFDEEKSKSLDWQARRHIIIGIARGLLYLHQDSRLTIIHRDLKASNILLDKEMNPKISDFGIARIFRGDEIQANTEKVIGTLGYMSPEYAMDGTFSLKSDVYSFGVLLLEIISSKKNREVVQPQPRLSLLKHAWSLWNDRKALDLVDKSMSCSFSIPEVLRYIKVGLLCVQEDPEDRPTMSSIILMLASDDVLLPNPKYPGYIAATYVNRMNDSFIKHVSHTVNNVTISMLNGR